MRAITAGKKPIKAYSEASQNTFNSDAVLDENGVLHITETHLLEFSEPEEYKQLTKGPESPKDTKVPPLTYRWTLPTNSDGKTLGVFKLKNIQYRMPSSDGGSETVKPVEAKAEQYRWAADTYLPDTNFENQPQDDYEFPSICIYFANLYEKLPAKARKDSMVVELTVEYEVDKLVRVYSEDAELDWTIFGTHWKKRIENATATLTLPAKRQTLTSWYCHGGTANKPRTRPLETGESQSPPPRAKHFAS